MAKCGICKLFGHNAIAHRQVCAICGGAQRLVDRMEDVDPNWKCDDQTRHRAIREGFGDPSLVAQVREPLQTVAALQKELKGQTKLSVVK